MLPPLKERKRALRAALRKALTELPPERRLAESRQLCHRVRELPEYRKARTVSLFCPMPFEVNLLPLLTEAELGSPKRFLFPLTHGDRSLTWHAAASLTALSAGRMGILEPDPSQSPAVDPEEIDLVLVPGLGFTREGGRLGFGGGYYDRFLAKIRPNAAVIAVCLSCQIVPAEDLPLEAHDVRMPLVLHG